MGRRDHVTAGTEITLFKIASGSLASRTAPRWALFCGLMLVLKFLLLWFDATPKVFMGDSGSYIYTALTGWIPPDRSYFYGYLVRWLAVWPHSFTPLLLSQALAGAAIAIVFALICSRFFEVSNNVSFLFGSLCALDPCQLVWERYVMTETFSLLVYMLVLYWSLAYLRDRQLWQLAVVQAISVVLIGFRMSYLPVVQACTILLPVIAFAAYAFRAARNRATPYPPRSRVLATALLHVIASLAMMFVMHGSYKYANGWLSSREPGYLYKTGAHLVAVWAPALEPSDAVDPRFGNLIAKGRQFHIKSLDLRDAQQFGKGFLVDRWDEIEKRLRRNDRVERQTALNALRRRPLEIVDLAVKTYLGYCGIESIQRNARKDLGYGHLSDEQLKILAENFGFITGKPLPAQPLSLLQKYFVAAWPYYFVVIISSVICAVAIFMTPHRVFAFLVFVHASILMGVVTALSARASVRYLQPLSVLTLLSIAVCVDSIAKRRKPKPPGPAPGVIAVPQVP